MTRSRASLKAISILAFIPLGLFAQANSGESPLRRITPTDFEAANNLPPAYEVTLKWNERGSSVVSVPLTNDSDKPLKVIGVQATRGVFIGDYPSTVAPKNDAKVYLVYESAENTEGDTDIIRFLTDQGIKEILVKVTRERVASFDTRHVTWKVGASPEAQAVKVTVVTGATMPKAVRTIKGASATLEFPGAGQYVIKIQPDTTDHPHTFPVFVDFDPALPGGAVVVTCIIEKK